MNILDDYGCISFTDESINRLNSFSAEELSALIERIKTITTHTIRINIVNSLPDAEKFTAIAKAFLCQPSYNSDTKEFVIIYTKNNFQLTQKLEEYLLEASIATNTSLKRVSYSFAEIEDISVENLLIIIGKCNYPRIHELDLNGCKLQNLNIDDLKLIIKACKDEKFLYVILTWWDLIEQDQTWKDKFASMTYADQQEVALEYLELFMPPQIKTFSVADLNRIPFDQKKYPDAFYDLLVSYFAVSQSVVRIYSLLHSSKEKCFINRQQLHQLILKMSGIKYDTQDADFAVLNISTICRLIQESSDPGMLAQFLTEVYEFTNPEEKKLFLEAIFGKIGYIPSLFGIAFEFEEIISISNELQNAYIASLYLHENAKDLILNKKYNF